jgi:hypothetical protein
MCKHFVLIYPKAKDDIDRQEFQELLFRRTNGHRGLLHLLLSVLEKKQGKLFRNYLDSFNMHMDVMNSRCLTGFKSNNLTTKEQFLLLQVIQSTSNTARIPEDGSHVPCVKAGYLTTIDDKHVIFACPMIQSSVQYALCTMDRPTNIKKPNNLKEFVLGGLKMMRKKQFQNTPSTNKQKTEFEPLKVSEKFWQSEFYYGASRVLPDEIFLSSEVGSALGITGFIDFVVDSELLWGIEFLLEFNDRKGHIGRFDVQGGSYSDADLNDWLVVEFQQKSKQDKKLKIEDKNQTINKKDLKHFWIVKCDEDFEDFEVIFPDGQSENFQLQ